MEKFTKGGWEFNRSIDRVVDAEGETICATGDSWNSYRNSEANASLIAAAPEMYEMLNSIRQCLEWGYTNAELVDNTNEYKSGLNALLAKARGEK